MVLYELSPCKSCQSTPPNQFNGEIALHFPGLEGLNKRIVWVFPKIKICLNCGFAEFTVPERELRALDGSTAIDDARLLIDPENSEKVS